MAQIATSRSLIEAGLSRSFAHHVVAGTRVVGLPLAIWLHDMHGLIVPGLADKSKREVALLRSMYPPSAPRSVHLRAANNDRTLPVSPSIAHDPRPPGDAAPAVLGASAAAGAENRGANVSRTGAPS